MKKLIQAAFEKAFTVYFWLKIKFHMGQYEQVHKMREQSLANEVKLRDILAELERVVDGLKKSA